MVLYSTVLISKLISPYTLLISLLLNIFAYLFIRFRSKLAIWIFVAMIITFFNSDIFIQKSVNSSHFDLYSNLKIFNPYSFTFSYK